MDGSGDTYYVTATPGTGLGTMRLDVLDDDSIVDLAGRPLGGAGTGNGQFENGPSYTFVNPRVLSIVRADLSPTSASRIKFTVRFLVPVTGVNLVAPFSDFSLITSGVTGAAITAVSGMGTTYTVTINTGSGNGAIHLNLLDDDTIRSKSGRRLGGLGAGNGNFRGQIYTVRKIPALLSPAGIGLWNRTPVYKWSNNIPSVTQYQYQVWRDTTLLYTRNVLPASCTRTTCRDAPGMFLPPARYTWRVRAAASGIWQPFTAYQAFSVVAPKAGYWQAGLVDFYVAPDRTNVKDFSIYIRVAGCGDYGITHTVEEPISKGKFSFDGSFFGSGSFAATETIAGGDVGLTSYYIPGCGYVTGGPYYWTAVWQDASQPYPGPAIELLAPPGSEGPFPGPFIIEPVQP